DKCTTPRNTNGICINIHNCEPLVETLKKHRPLSNEIINYLHSLNCGYEGSNPKVCCEQNETCNDEIQQFSQSWAITQTTEKSNQSTSEPADVTNHPNLKLLNHEICGPISQMKIFGGNKTGIFDFPWMALLSYNVTGQGTEFRCGGSLINKRYVLTAAHCVTELPSTLKLIRVRLGEHDLSTERDCDRDADGLEVVCAEKYQDIDIEDVHFHPEFSSSKFKNDIALLRLNRDADFRPQNVRPICMPIGSAAKFIQKKVIVTGWGSTELLPRSSDLLQVQLLPVNIDECAKIYKRQEIWYKQMCAGGKMGTDSCSGDSGGPLQAPGMYNINTHYNSVKYVQHGIVSYGPNSCGTEGLPGVYTKIVYYLDWILDTIRA
ncbi:unnamed protein product, partial [Heterotrigona itama]